ncbi:MAG: enoyl-CoA hydratase/isomerase family protein [Microthrixaceae bacterium]|nr:enoyl-CoA hydratase/isomerase family protein [Microthrixaceae bacterium]
MSYKHILFEKRDHIGYVTLNRPDQMNAFTATMAFELMDVFDQTDADDDVKVVVVTGSGRAFCAGADLSSGGGSFDIAKAVGSGSGDKANDDGGSPSAPVWPMVTDDRGRSAPADLGGLLVLRIYRSLKPVIAAINGSAVGVGITMTLPMDVRLSVDGSKIGFVFNRRGISIDGAASWFLPRIVGIGRALEWVNTGRVFRASDALSAGLVSEVLPDSAAVVARAEEIAREIIDNCAPVSVAVSRRLLWDALGDPDPTMGHNRESTALLHRGMSADVRAGVEAFLAKTPPQFVDRVSSSEEVRRP